MQFSSLFFLFVFLPLFLLTYRLVKGIEKRNLVLLIYSLVFYAFGGLRYVLLLLIMSAAGWAAGRMIERAEEARQKNLYRTGAVILFIVVLLVFKYTGFFLGTFGAIFAPDAEVLRIAMPLGISFYVFKLISYVCDVCSGKTEAEESFLIFLIYVACFHHVVQGPIVRYADLREQFYERRFNRIQLAAGMYRFAVGLAKKVLIADHCGSLADGLVPMSEAISSMPTAGVWLGMIFYTLQIYFDFSGYSDMAIGLGQMVGFTYPENFNYPYIADSVRDFWRRWHISLSQFFRDYVYIPLGGNRRGQRRQILNLLAVWALTGFWHGASWNFILWGLFYFAFIVLENYLTKTGNFNWPAPLKHLYTGIIFVVGWIFFRFSDFRQMGWALRGFFGFHKNGFTSQAVRLSFTNDIFFLIFACLAATPLFSYLGRLIEQNLKAREIPLRYLHIAKTVTAIVLFILAVCALAGSSFRPFIYNQF